jgi:hypothetical protein
VDRAEPRAAHGSITGHVVDRAGPSGAGGPVARDVVGLAERARSKPGEQVNRSYDSGRERPSRRVSVSKPIAHANAYDSAKTAETRRHHVNQQWIAEWLLAAACHR